jgi:uncharacterized protein
MTWSRLGLSAGRVLAVPLLALIRAYQAIVSPFLGQRCRFYPSCSQYAVQAIRARGPIVGVGLAGWRLLRCNPWNAGGYDPVRGAHEHQSAAAVGSSPSVSAPSTTWMQGA